MFTDIKGSSKRHVCSFSVDNNGVEFDCKFNNHSSVARGGRGDVRASDGVIPDYTVSLHGRLA